MVGDLGTLQTAKVIVHEVPQKQGGASPPPLRLSEVESPLTPPIANYFRERVIEGLASTAYDVVFDEVATSPVPNLVSLYLKETAADFVATSRDIAQHLFNCQPTVSPSGLLCVIDSRLANKRAITVLKLEKEEAVSLNHIDVGGKPTYDLAHLSNLVLNKKTRVFKVGLFGPTTRGHQWGWFRTSSEGTGPIQP